MLQAIKNIRTQALAAPRRLLLIASVVAVVLGTSGVAAMVAWPTDARDAAETLVSGRPAAPLKASCAECGVVVSVTDIRTEQRDDLAARAMGRVAEASDKHYEVALRMRDGSSRVFMAAGPAHWRAGERVVLIEAAAPSND